LVIILKLNIFEVKVGIKEIVLAISYKPDAMKEYIAALEKKVKFYIKL
jgi:hypothetical protein